MNDPEWAAFSLELEHAFRGDFGPSGPDDVTGLSQEMIYRRHFGDVDYDVAVAAVALLIEDGQVFLPKLGELRTAVQRVTTRACAPFAEVLTVFGRAVSRYSIPRGHGTPDDVRAAEARIVAYVAEHAGEGAARWIQARGSRSLAAEQCVEGEHSGAVRHRLEGEYSEFVKHAEEDGRIGRALASAERVALEAGRSGLRTLDAASVLGIPTGDRAELTTGGNDGR